MNQRKNISSRTDAPWRVSIDSKNITTATTVQTRHGASVQRAFTLIELIVTITILAILGTIGFLSFQGYSSSARDSVRISDLTNIQKGLSIYQIKSGYYPMPDDPVNITASSVVIGYQGYIGDLVLKNINLSNGGKDPLDNVYYTYNTNVNKTKYQILGFLENSNNVMSYELGVMGNNKLAHITSHITHNNYFNKLSNLELINKVYADSSDYSSRYLNTKGDELGIILQSGTLVPIQASGTGVDVVLTNTGYIAIFANNTDRITGTGINLATLKSSYKDGKLWTSLDKNCTNPDVIIGDQIWAGCNSTLGDGVEWGKKDDGSVGIITSCFGYNSTNNTGSCLIENPTMASNAKENSWSGASGISGVVDNIWGKFYNFNQAKTACPIGWKVPSDQDFLVLESTLGCVDSSIDNDIRCDGLGWSGSTLRNITNNIVKALKIPIGGLRSTDEISFLARGSSSYLWTSSSTSNITAYYKSLHWTLSGVGRYPIGDKLFSFPVRCLKN